MPTPRPCGVVWFKEIASWFQQLPRVSAAELMWKTAVVVVT
jgi:hypothetical protein